MTIMKSDRNKLALCACSLCTAWLHPPVGASMGAFCLLGGCACFKRTAANCKMHSYVLHGTLLMQLFALLPSPGGHFIVADNSGKMPKNGWKTNSTAVRSVQYNLQSAVLCTVCIQTSAASGANRCAKMQIFQKFKRRDIGETKAKKIREWLNKIPISRIFLSPPIRLNLDFKAIGVFDVPNIFSE